MNRVNSKEYWEKRFTEQDWEKNRGGEQTKYFYELLVKMLPQWIVTEIRKEKYTVIDFGCAEGQGVPILQEKLGTKIIGMDFAEGAIQQARLKFPQHTFEVGDITNYGGRVDVAIMSNILEHFTTPYNILEHISKCTNKYMVVMVPFEEENLMTEHCYTFRFNNIPIAVNGFQLVQLEEYDCLKDANNLFLGKQVLLIYSQKQDINETISYEQMNRVIPALRQQIRDVQDKFQQKFEKSQFEVEKNHMIAEKKQLELELANKERAELEALNEQKNAQLVNERSAYCELNGRYVELSERFNSLNDTYGYTKEKYREILDSYTWKIGSAQLNALKKVKLLAPVKKYMDARLQKNNIEENLATELDSNLEQILAKQEVSDDITNYIKIQGKLFRENIDSPLGEISLKLQEIIKTRRYKGIVVYPHAVKWEPIQRPQHFLREFSKKGFLCFFCENEECSEDIAEPYENVFVVKNGELNLLPVLQDKAVIVLITFYLQTLFSKFLPQKVIWFDILDRLDFFDGNGDISKDIYRELISKANIVSFSANNLKEYVSERKDAIKLPNAVNLDDFKKRDEEIPKEILTLKEKGKKIIGYYGAIEEWFDWSAVKYLADQTDYEIVLIGAANEKIKDKLQHNQVHFLGRKPYKSLYKYANYFDVALLPFVVNDLTNSVSPVKFFEYAAMGLPVVSSNIHEMKQYAAENVKLYSTKEEFVDLVKSLAIRYSGKKVSFNDFIKQNTWEQRIDVFLKSMKSQIGNLKVLANTDSSGSVAVNTVTFFKYDGTTYYSGGAERYLLDLDEICEELNIRFRVYQYGEYDWVRFYNNVEVIGLGAKQNDVNVYSVLLKQEMEEAFKRNTQNKSLVDIYSAFNLLQRKDSVTSIGISHGIFWDNEANCFTNGTDFWRNDEEIIRAAKYCDYMVSVDTNTCNWFQTIDYQLSKKMKYIPNYVDNQEFAPGERNDKEKIIITYPRRLYGARGLYIVLDVIDDVLNAFENVEFHFVGKGFEQDTKYVEQKICKWGDRVKWYSQSPDKMHEVYKYTDISLVPTMYSEGTSLSCLEALSSGNVVVCTRVGGLTDLILNDYNGILIEPDKESLKEALFELLNSPEKMKTLKKNAVLTAQAFSKSKWKERWKKILKRAIGEQNTAPYEYHKRCMIKLTKLSVQDDKVINCICKYLDDGYYVYVASPEKTNKFHSFQRLQFILLDEDLYFEPDVILTETEI